MITIRSVTWADCEPLLTLTQAAFAANTSFDEDFKPGFLTPTSAEEFFRENIENPDGCFLVAEEAGTLVGYVSGYPKDIPYRKSKYFEVDTLGVDPSVQRRGVGRQLMLALEDWCREHGYQKLYLNCYARNEVAIGFYETFGFELIDVCLEKSI